MMELETSDPDLHQSLTETLVEALETMAFISPMPLSAPPGDVPPTLRRVSISFTGPSNGSLEITTSLRFGTILAANLMGVDPIDSVALRGADDALKELANVACGLLLRRRNGGFELAPPVLNADPTPAWPETSDVSPIVALEAEGSTIVARLIII